MVDEETNPEASYRRGYAHGAKQVFDAVAAALPLDIAAKVERWLSEDVNVWRLANLRGVDSTSHCSPHFTSDSVRQRPNEVLFW
jgi:hypothetical protein